MRQWLLLLCAWCVSTRANIDRGQNEAKNDLRQQRSKVDPAMEGVDSYLRNKDSNCILCEKRHIISVDEDFNKLKSDTALNQHVSAILDRLKTFKIPVHPRIRLFYELLKVGMSDYAYKTADSLYVPHKYNVPETFNKKT